MDVMTGTFDGPALLPQEPPVLSDPEATIAAKVLADAELSDAMALIRVWPLDGGTAGAVKRPVGLMVPSAGSPPGLPLAYQATVTPGASPMVVAVNCMVVPATMVGEAGQICMLWACNPKAHRNSVALLILKFTIPPFGDRAE